MGLVTSMLGGATAVGLLGAGEPVQGSNGAPPGLTAAFAAWGPVGRATDAGAFHSSWSGAAAGSASSPRTSELRSSGQQPSVVCATILCGSAAAAAGVARASHRRQARLLRTSARSRTVWSEAPGRRPERGARVVEAGNGGEDDESMSASQGDGVFWKGQGAEPDAARFAGAVRVVPKGMPADSRRRFDQNIRLARKKPGTPGYAAFMGEEEEEEPELEENEDEINPEDFVFGNRKPFSELGLENPRLLKALDTLGLKGSTKIQAAAIPSILSDEKRAVVINSETGSGKTLCYLLPAFELALQDVPRSVDAKAPHVMIVVPSRELVYQLEQVATRISKLVSTKGRAITVASSFELWPARMPDILIVTPKAAANGLRPCSDSTDEITRREALARIKDMRLLVMDEVDALFDDHTLNLDVETILIALSASWPLGQRKVMKEAEVFHKDGIPCEMLDSESMQWRPVRAFYRKDGSLNCYLGEGIPDFDDPEFGQLLSDKTVWARRIKRRNLKGPGMGLVVEEGTQVVMCGATLPSYMRSSIVSKLDPESPENVRRNAQRIDFHGLVFHHGVGSIIWTINRWFPQALYIKSEHIHCRHPCIVQQEWIPIAGEPQTRTGDITNMGGRIAKTIEILQEQGPDVRTLVFTNGSASCQSVEQQLAAEKINCAGFYSAMPFDARIDSLKKFMRGEVSVLVCTDKAARGLDLPICRHIIQLNFPKNVVSHIHRVGRAARGGRLSKTTILWGAKHRALKDTIMKAPNMGLDGQIWSKSGNRFRLRGIRTRMKKQELQYAETRVLARAARFRTQRDAKTLDGDTLQEVEDMKEFRKSSIPNWKLLQQFNWKYRGIDRVETLWAAEDQEGAKGTGEGAR